MYLLEKIIAVMSEQIIEFIQKDVKKILIANRATCAEIFAKVAMEFKIPCVIAATQADYEGIKWLRDGVKQNLFFVEIIPSYTDSATLVQAAQKNNCDSLIPGWGFISESAEFSKACEDANINFVGPTAFAMNQLGDKDSAKKIARQNNVPVIKGIEQDTTETLNSFGEKILKEFKEEDYPLLVKAVAGGGGRGQRIIEKKPTTLKELIDTLTEAKSEGENLFNNGRLLIEQFIRNGRHIEIQIVRDKTGHSHAFSERECSTQRKHQKVLEESMTPLSENSKQDDSRATNKARIEMREEAVRLANAVDYTHAGTVEFLVDADTGEHYFIEMNTRLQVEHPVTNLIFRNKVTGERLNLIKMMLHIANGDTPNFENWEQKGHAIEARILAEGPGENNAKHGVIRKLTMPKSSEDTVVECAFQNQDTVSSDYDSMIGKIIVWGETREEAIQKLKEKLREIKVESQNVKLNIRQLLALLDSQEFQSKTMLTSTITRKPEVMAINSDEFETSDQLHDVTTYIAGKAAGIIETPGLQKTESGEEKKLKSDCPETSKPLPAEYKFSPPTEIEEKWNAIGSGLLIVTEATQKTPPPTEEELKAVIKSNISLFLDKIEEKHGTSQRTFWENEIYQIFHNMLVKPEESKVWIKLFTLIQNGDFNWQQIHELGREQETLAIHIYTTLGKPLKTDLGGRDSQQSLIQDRIHDQTLADLHQKMEEIFGHTYYSRESDGGAVPDVQGRFMGNLAFVHSDKIKAATHCQVNQMLLRALNGIAYGNISPSLLDSLVAKFKEHGIHVFRIFDCLNNLEALKIGAEAVRKVGGTVQACISFTVDDLSTPEREKKYTVEYWKNKCDQIMHELSPDQLAFKDMSSQLTPEMVKELTSYLTKKYPKLVLSLHAHNDSKIASLVSKAFIEAGGHIYDVSFIPTHTPLLETTTHEELAEDGVNPQAVDSIKGLWEEVFDYYEPFKVTPLDPVLTLIAQIPGGMWANFHSQAKENGVNFENQVEWVHQSLLEDIKTLQIRYPHQDYRDTPFGKEYSWIWEIENLEDVKRIDAGRTYIIFAYRLSRHLMGNVPTVTPSSKVCGEIAIELTKIPKGETESALDKIIKDFTTENSGQIPNPHILFKWLEPKLCADPTYIPWPKSGLQYFQGNLGTPDGNSPEDKDGFPQFRDSLLQHHNLEKLQSTPSFNFKESQNQFIRETGILPKEEDVIMFAIFGDVYKDVFINRYDKFGPAEQVLTPRQFFNGLDIGETAHIKLNSKKEGETEHEITLVDKHETLNKFGGKTITIELIVDGEKQTIVYHTNPKATKPNEIGTPGAGKLCSINVIEGDVIQEGQPLYVMTIFKMERTIKAKKEDAGKVVEKVESHLLKTTNALQKGDLILTFKSE